MSEGGGMFGRGLTGRLLLETNLYSENAVLVLNPANYAFDVICAKGRQQVDRGTLTPLVADAGVHDLTLEVRDQSHTVVARGKTRLRLIPAEAGAAHPCHWC